MNLYDFKIKFDIPNEVYHNILKCPIPENLSSIPRGIIMLMGKNQLLQRGEFDLTAFKHGIASGFLWLNTDEGHDFWEDIDKHSNDSKYLEIVLEKLCFHKQCDLSDTYQIDSLMSIISIITGFTAESVKEMIEEAKNKNKIDILNERISIKK